MSMDEFFAALCRAMGWEPTPWRIETFKYWASREGISNESTAHNRLDFHWNPLATTWEGRRNLAVNPFGAGAGKWNNANPPYGVGIYADAEAGIEAISLTLKARHYPNIRRCFADQVGYPEVVGDFKTYVGSEAYGQAVLQFMRSNTASREPIGTPTPDTLTDADLLLLALYAGQEQRDEQGNTLPVPTRLSYARWKATEAAAGRAPSIGEMAAAVADHDHGGVRR